MRRNPKKQGPTIRPPLHIELSEKHIRLRVVAIAVFAAIAVVALGFGLYKAFSTEEGWRTIEAVSDAKTTCAGELIFQYQLGASDKSATAEYKAVTRLYTDATDDAYRLFSSDEYEGFQNLAEVNHRINQVVDVAPAVYEALQAAEASGSRYLFLAPILDQYGNLFGSAHDEEAAAADPYHNAELRENFAKIASYANDPEMIRLELPAENQVKLVVSQEYQRFAKEDGITIFADFSGLRNAFIVDYVAERLMDAGYCYGTISSYDGFSRTLGGDSYSFNIYDLQDKVARNAAVMNCKAPFAIVNMRSYPLNNLDSLRYYEYQTGEIRASYVDASDGLCKTAISDLTCLSADQGCGPMALAMMPLYASSQLDEEALLALRQKGITAVYCVNQEVRCTGSEVNFEALYDQDGVTYTVKRIS